jgi:hypothetical protein
MPRSGTSWLSQIFDSAPCVRFRLSPLFSYEFKNALDEHATRDEWLSVLRRAYASDNEFMDQRYRRATGEYPLFTNKDPNPDTLVVKDTRFHNLAEPLLLQFPELRIVALIRHPAAAINSWLRAPREFPASAVPDDNWRSGACRKTGPGEYWGFDDWKRTTQQYLRLANQRPDQVFVQRYEDLVREALSSTQRIFEFCGLSLTHQTVQFISRSQTEEHESEYAVFKSPSVASSWRGQLDASIIDAIESDLRGSDLEVFLK